jgi:2-dehydro-3-deoxyphosphogluconate aldolase/(4S)-4-hydroxy-2-oxoglutarate aldolase
VGAGTVPSEVQAATAISCGARFVVAPSLNLSVSEACSAGGIVYIPGVLTHKTSLMHQPTGTRCSSCSRPDPGDRQPQSATRPVPNDPLDGHWGIEADRASDWLAALASTVGLGSSLAPCGAKPGPLIERVRELVKRVCDNPA